MTPLSPKQKRVFDLAQKGGRDTELFLLDTIHELEDKIDSISIGSAVPEMNRLMNVLQKILANIELVQGKQGIEGEKGSKGDRGERGAEGYTPKKGVDYFDGENGRDGRNPLKVSPTPPLNPQIGDLWYQS